MARLPIVSWIGNAASVLVGKWGAVSRQAETAGCSRQTAYDHAEKVEAAVRDAAGGGPSRQQLQQQVRRQAERLATLEKRLAEATEFPEQEQQRFAATSVQDIIRQGPRESQCWPKSHPKILKDSARLPKRAVFDAERPLPLRRFAPNLIVTVLESSDARILVFRNIRSNRNRASIWFRSQWRFLKNVWKELVRVPRFPALPLISSERSKLGDLLPTEDAQAARALRSACVLASDV